MNRYRWRAIIEAQYREARKAHCYFDRKTQKKDLSNMGSCKETRAYDSSIFLVQNERGIQNELGKYSD